MTKSRELSEDEVIALQQRIINEHWTHTKEAFGTHIYQTWWDIDGVKYTLCQAMRDDVLPLGWEVL